MHGCLRPVKGSYFFFARAILAAVALLAPKRLVNFSTRPAVSTNFCWPVKKGWHAAQMPQVLFRRAGVIDRAAGADDLAFHILGVNVRFHGSG